jgi:hypothetical protein
MTRFLFRYLVLLQFMKLNEVKNSLLNVLIQWSSNLLLKLVTYATFRVYIVLSLVTPVFSFRNKIVYEPTVMASHMKIKHGLRL